MIDLNISLTDEQAQYLNDSKNETTKAIRIGKLFGIKRDDIFNYLETNDLIEGLIKCSFCNSIRSFKYNYKILNNKIFISDITYEKELFICSRRDNELTLNCKSKKLNSNSKEYVKHAYGFDTLEEANEYILKRNKSPFYKNNHATEEDYKKYQTRDKKWYEDHNKDYDVYIKSCSYRNSINYFIERYGEEIGPIEHEKFNKSKDSSSLTFFINRYGEELGTELFDIKNSKTKQTLENFISRYGELGEELYREYINKKSNSLREFIATLTDEERILKYDSISKSYFQRRYGDDWEHYYLISVANAVTGSPGRASKESLIFFEKLIDKISYLNLKYYIGVDELNEYFIYDNQNNKFNLYDFCIRDLKIIIEYHGSLWHFNPNFKYKGTLPFGMNIENHKKSDEYKKNLAVEKGFDYFVVFDTDDKDLKAIELANIIIEKFNNKGIK